MRWSSISPRLAASTLLAALVVLPGAAPPPREAQEGLVGDIAQLLALEDRREYDGVALARAAQHPDTLVRIRAAMALGRIGDAAAVPALRRLLMDPDTAVRIEAAFALGELGSREAVPELANLVDALPASASGNLVWELVTALAKIGGPDADRALDRLLERHVPDGPNSDRATAVALLEAWRLGDTSLVARRLEPYVRLARGDWRRHAVYSVTRMRMAGVGEALLAAAADEDPLTRAWVAAGLRAQLAEGGGPGREVLVARLRTMLDDREAQVRTNALRGLATFLDSSLAPLAAARLLDRDPNTAIQAAQTLGALRGSRAAAALAERFTGAGTFGLRRALLVALAPLDGTRALQLAGSWRSDADWRNRWAWIEVAVAARGDSARPALTALLADADPRVSGAALAGLAQLPPPGDEAVIAAARARLAHPDVGVRTTALGILGRSGRSELLGDIIAAYRRAEREESNDARLAAIEAVGRIAAASAESRAAAEDRFFSSVTRSSDYLVRRAVRQRFGEATYERTWRTVWPAETGRAPEDYRALARRYVLRTEAAPTRVTIETERGSIVIELFGYEAPLTVDNFLRLAQRRFYDGGRWHRVVPNFVVQDGDPRGDGTGGPGTVLRDEINRRRYQRGTVGMALSGPDTGGSQFFICHSPQPHLDGGYTAFGQVLSGWQALDMLVQGDRLRRMVPAS